MPRFHSYKNRLRGIEHELAALKVFRITPQLRKFQRQLMGELSFVKNEISRLQSTQEKKGVIKKTRLDQANKNRSEKMKRIWRYLKAIQQNYPTKLSLRELRSALKKHRQGLETDISDVAWRNPSP